MELTGAAGEDAGGPGADSTVDGPFVVLDQG